MACSQYRHCTLCSWTKGSAERAKRAGCLHSQRWGLLLDMHVSPVVTYTDSVRAQERYTLTVHSISGIYAFGMLVSVLAPIIDLVDASCCSRNLQTSVSLLATCETMIGTKHKRRCGSRFSQKDSVRGRTTGGCICFLGLRLWGPSCCFYILGAVYLLYGCGTSRSAHTAIPTQTKYGGTSCFCSLWA